MLQVTDEEMDNYPFGTAPFEPADGEEYFATLTIPMEDDLIHTDENPTCADPTCPCHSEEGGQ